LRQLISVIVLLLSSKEPAAMYCAQTVVDFILITQYKTYNNKTLCYINHILYRIDRMKITFRTLCSIDKLTDKSHFNFSKFYIIIYYTLFIQDFETADNFDTEYSKTVYKY
jgi:hypothetical protein